MHGRNDAHREYARDQGAHQGKYDDNPFRQTLLEIHSVA
jgi:hypothetical protein